MPKGHYARRGSQTTKDKDGAPPHFVIEDSLGYLVNAAARLLARALHSRIVRHGVPIGQWPFLLFLWEEEGLSQTELSRRIPIDEATTVRTLDRMERDGWVRRARNARDRRQVQVFLTRAGHGLKATLLPHAVAVNDQATQGLGETQKALLNALLREIIVRLTDDDAPWPSAGPTGRAKARGAGAKRAPTVTGGKAVRPKRSDRAPPTAVRKGPRGRGTSR